MRLSELLDHEVVDERGHRLGVVHEVLLVQDGPRVAHGDHALRLHGLDVGPGGIARRLGYGRGAVNGPWLLRTVLGRQRTGYVPWERVRSVADVITITGEGLEPERPTTRGEP